MLPEVLLNLSKISATVHIAIPVLEFLSSEYKFSVGKKMCRSSSKFQHFFNRETKRFIEFHAWKRDKLHVTVKNKYFSSNATADGVRQLRS